MKIPSGARGADAVERQRARRAFQAALPPLADVRRHPLRQRLQAAWEAAEWEERATALEQRDEARLSAVQAALAHQTLQVLSHVAGLPLI
ncbi:hypothetical protein WJX81_000980 [Elliptochloris bilobata]|uniref:Cilia- and flagella-associated protein 91 n=1 Tax=Elliptochloris bilobata TaxID=381761 RepID=A0AAW1QZV1_9CHLO